MSNKGTFGDWYGTPDGRFGCMKGHGEGGRVKMWDVNGDFIGWYNRDDLKFMHHDHYTPRTAETNWLADVTKRLNELRDGENGLLFHNSFVRERILSEYASGKLSQHAYDQCVVRGYIQSDGDYQKALLIREEIAAIINAPIENYETKIERRR